MRKGTIKIFNELIEFKDSAFLAVGIFIFLVLRLPSLIEPYWYGDEGIYEVMGMAINRGRLLYEGIWDNKPPLLYIIYAIFDGDLFLARFASLVFGVAAVFFFFLLAKKLFDNKFSLYLSTIIFSVLFAIPTLEGNIANAENFMLAPILAAFYFVNAAPIKKYNFNLAIGGILLSLAFLIKIVAIFDLAAIIATILVLKLTELNFAKLKIKEVIDISIELVKRYFVLILLFALPIIFTSIYFFIAGAFTDFARATFLQNVGYVGHGNTFIFPMGLIFLKVFLLIFSLLLIIKFRNNLGTSGILITVWLSFSLFNTFFSQRPYTHYLLVMIPSLCLFAGYILEKKKLMVVTIPLFLIIVFFINNIFHPNFRKNIAYYTNYLEFVSGKKSVVDYQAFFDRRTPLDYEIANFIKVKTAVNESVFLWSDSGQIYALSNKLPPGRYIVSYHITSYPDAINETKNAIGNVKPKYIIQTKDTPQIRNFLDNYQIRYKMDGVNIYERQL